MHATRSIARPALAGLMLALAIAAGPLAANAHATETSCGLPVCIPGPQPAPIAPTTTTTTTTTTSTTTPTRPTPSPADARAILLARMNRDRDNQHLPTLTERADVNAIAAGWSNRLADAGKLSHNDEYLSAASRQGLEARALGENVAQDGSPEAAHDLLMASPSHRANILDARFTVVGIGAVLRNGRWWITEDFLQPRDPAAAAPKPTPAAGVITRSSGARRHAPATGITVGLVPSTTVDAGDWFPTDDAGLLIATGSTPSKLVPADAAASRSHAGRIPLVLGLTVAGWCCRMTARRRLPSMDRLTHLPRELAKKAGKVTLSRPVRRVLFWQV